MSVKNVQFSINRYDKDGDNHEDGVYLHFGSMAVKVCDTPEEYKEFADRVAGMNTEILNQ